MRIEGFSGKGACWSEVDAEVVVCRSINARTGPLAETKAEGVYCKKQPTGEKMASMPDDQRDTVTGSGTRCRDNSQGRAAMPSWS